MPPRTDAGLGAGALADQAVAAALDADWPRAIELNTKILETSPDDVEGRNRLGRALIEQGKLEEAKAAFAEALKADPCNPMAIRGSQRASALLEPKARSFTTSTNTKRGL